MIQHIDDLLPDQILNIFENIDQYSITEKIDGSNLFFGFDQNQRFFTTRGGKGQHIKYYHESDYPNLPQFNGFRSAHAALFNLLCQFEIILPDKMLVECEVLYGTQPNTISYDGINRIVLLSSNYPDTNTFNKLQRHLACNYTHAVATKNDYIPHFEQTTERAEWLIDSVPVVKHNIFNNIDLVPLKKWCQNNPGDKFNTKKQHKLQSEQTIAQFKHQLVNILHNYQPKFASTCVTGIEGLVLSGNDQVVKIVDKKTFTAVNQFYHSIRNQIKQTSRHRNHNHNALLDVRCSIYDDMLESICDVLQLPRGFEHNLTIIRSLKKFDGLQHLIECMNFNNLKSTKNDIEQIIITTTDNLQTQLDHFHQNNDCYQITINNKIFKYTAEVNKRTVTCFGQMSHHLNNMLYNIKNSSTHHQLLTSIYAEKIDRAFPS